MRQTDRTFAEDYNKANPMNARFWTFSSGVGPGDGHIDALVRPGTQIELFSRPSAYKPNPQYSMDLYPARRTPT
jgi:hypothetical protein